MKQLLITIAALVLVGCGESQESANTPEAEPVEPLAEAAKPETPTVKAPDISIHRAVEKGNIEAVKQHLSAGTDVNSRMGRGRGYYKTPIDYALINLRTFENYFTPPNLKDKIDPHNTTEIIDLLSRHGGHSGSIYTAAQFGDINGVKSLLKESVNINKIWGPAGSPLNIATANGHKDIVSLLIEKGAKVDFPNWRDYTAFHFAIEKAHIDIANLLLLKGANINFISKDLGTPLDIAKLYKNKMAVDFLLKNNALTKSELRSRDLDLTQISLHKAVQNRDVSTIKRLLAAGADVNIKDEDGFTPLQYAAYKEEAELLVANGADVNTKDKNGWSILHTSSDFLVPLAKVVIENGANLDAKTPDGSTPLHHAILHSENILAKLLIDNGADVNAIDNDGWVPLHYADDQLSIVELLIAKGANVNAKTYDGRTTLDLRSELNQIKYVNLLRKHGAKTGEELKAEGK